MIKSNEHFFARESWIRDNFEVMGSNPVESEDN